MKLRGLYILSCLVSSLLAESLTRVENTSLQLPAEAPVEGGYVIENAFGSLEFNAPIALATPPGETQFIYVVERAGTIQRVNLATNTSSLFLDLGTWVESQGQQLITFGENGLLSMAFHPDYNQNGYFYVFYSLRATSQDYQRIARIQANGTAGQYLSATTADASTHQSLITQYDEAVNHNGGDMHFGPDGYLYISVGDEGGSNDSFNNSNFINKDFFSAILRIDVDNLPGNLTPNPHTQNSFDFPSAITPESYSIPADNPFVGATSHQGSVITPSSVRSEIWVTGLRNPWRFSFDSATDRCFVADVGQNAREEINLVSGGEDCGWSRREGFIAFPFGPAGSNIPPGYNPHDPIFDYPRSDGTSITGGIVYRGSRLGELFGRYIFADFNSDVIWSLTEDASGGWSRSFITSRGFIASFGEDPRNQDLLLCDLVQGIVGRLVRSTANPAPTTLSQTGAFSDLGNLTPETGVYAYDINQPFWSDHAIKRRWFSIPDLADEVSYSETSPWIFPTGQVWIKHFDLEVERGNPASLRPIETRFLVKTDTGIYGLSYRWRSDGSEADLVGASGLDEDFEIIDNGMPITQTWNYPSRTSCLACHTQDSGYALSFNIRQLNRGGALGNDQITCLSTAGFLDSTPSPSRGLPAHPQLSDTTISLESRVRSYLDINCSMCHRGNESIVPGSFDARITTQTDLADIIDGFLVNDLGDSSNRFIVPNDTTHSTVLARLDGSAGRMPPLASTVIDQEAIDLMTQWITSDLPSRQSYDQWAFVNFGNSNMVNTIENADYDQDGQSNILEYLTGTDPTTADSTFGITLDNSEFSYFHPANRQILIESSTDLFDWKVFEHVNNSSLAPANSGTRTFPIPDEEHLFLRARISPQ